MIDIHSHILPGVDDGSKSFEESIEIIKKAEENGVSDIILTPHYIKGSIYHSGVRENKKILRELKAEVEKEGIPVRLYLGNEVFVESDMIQMVLDGEITTLNNSRYLLFELPLNQEFRNFDEVINSVRSNGLVPVIAHPERYGMVHENPLILNEMKRIGALFQSDVGAFFGKYGKSSEKMVKLLLKHDMIDFLASDIHRGESNLYEDAQEAFSYVEKEKGEEYAKKVFEGNQEKIFQDEEFAGFEYSEIRKTMFGYK